MKVPGGFAIGKKMPAGLAGFALAVAIGAAYLGSFSVPLLLDDVVTIVRNPSIRHLWPPGPI